MKLIYSSKESSCSSKNFGRELRRKGLCYICQNEAGPIKEQQNAQYIQKQASEK